jgi:heavy metal sensor kinase
MRSLRLRLILGSLLVLAAVIFSFGLFVYFAKSRALLSVLDDRLSAGARSLAGHVELDKGQLLFAPAEDYDIRGELPPAYRILDAQGRVIARSAVEFPPGWPAASPTEGHPLFLTTAGSGKDGRWRVVRLSARVTDERDSAAENGPSEKQTVLVTVQCATPLGPISRELEELAALLAVLALGAFLIAGGGSFFLAGRALRPIRRINEALANVSETRLDERLDPGPFDKELHPLIGQLNAALDRLEGAFRRERQFTADVSHELRTPVAGILSTIEVLLRNKRSENELREAHEDNLEIARAMESMIERLLLLARMDAGKASPARRSTSLAALVGEVLATAGPEARKRDIRLSHDVQAALRADIDPDQMKIVLGNLVDNGVRYNRPGGSVTVWARRSPEGLVIEVRDSGIGIPADQLPLIFDRFHRVDPSRSEGTGGCGLGLSIVRKIVEAHGGRISALSGPSGSAFSIIIPEA